MQKARKRAITSEEAVDTVQVTVRQPARATKARKPVQELQDRALKAVRCHYTEEFRREALQTAIPKRSLVSM